jgi:hypothetical protein
MLSYEKVKLFFTFLRHGNGTHTKEAPDKEIPYLPWWTY